MFYHTYDTYCPPKPPETIYLNASKRKSLSSEDNKLSIPRKKTTYGTPH